MLLESLDAGYNVRQYTAPINLLQDIKSGTHFDLIMCDLIMNSMNGLAFLAAVRSHSKKIPILMLSGINTQPPVADVIRLGGNGFVHKSVENEILHEAIQKLLAGERYFEDGLGDVAAMLELSDGGGFGEDAYEARPNISLPERQVEVLKLIALGASNNEIAENLGISLNTVKSHLKQIFTELGVNKRTACVRKAQMHGLI